MRALYLSGGGARGAYQVGVLKGIADVMAIKQGRLPFDVVSCVSVGAINGAFLASRLDDFPKAVEALEQLWRGLSCRRVFDDRNLAVFLSLLGGLGRLVAGRVPRGHLFDNQALEQLLNDQLDIDTINHNVQSGALKVFELAAYCYDLAETVSFVCAHDPYLSWRRVRHLSYQTPLSCEHILASTAIPIFFPSRKIGPLNYGDGTLRMGAPLRGVIKSGAEKIFIISTRARGKLGQLTTTSTIKGPVTFAKVIGSMMNGLILDNLDRDLEMMTHLNLRMRSGKLTSTHWRDINVLHIHPRIDIGEFALQYHRRVSMMIRYLLRALGGKTQAGDFLSFLLFDSYFTSALIDMGYEDALDNADNIQRFFFD